MSNDVLKNGVFMEKINLFSNNINSFGKCITREMSVKATELSALNLAQGFPEDDPPSEMLEEAIKAIRGHRNYYADMRGDPLLREAIALYAERFSKLKVDPIKEVTVTCGATEAMIISLLSLINPGDEVILFEPWYENYLAQTILSSAVKKYYLLEPPNFIIDKDKLEKIFSSKTKAIIINTPNNPTGRVFNKQELQIIADLCIKYNVIAISDEIYQHIIFDGNEHISIASLDGMYERTITINGISKAFASTGWRVGWAIANPEITNALRRVHDFITATVPTPFQLAAIKGLNLPDSYFNNLVELYTHKRTILSEGLMELNLSFLIPEGTYYILADISNLNFNSSDTLTDTLLHDAGVAVVPGSAYYQNKLFKDKYVRITFSKDLDTIKKAIIRLKEWYLKTKLR